MRKVSVKLRDDGTLDKSRPRRGTPPRARGADRAHGGEGPGVLRLGRSLGYTNYKVSLKSSNVLTAVEAYRKFSAASDVPLHLGITEAGTLVTGAVKSRVGFALLLADGIGDTIRVSLTAEPEEEIPVAYEILRSLDLRRAASPSSPAPRAAASRLTC